MDHIDVVSGEIVDAAMRLHRELGPGLLESVYETVLAAWLQRRGYKVERQKSVPILSDGMHFDAAFRIDLLVDSRLVVEIKSVEQINAAHAKQLLTYLRLLQQPVGLLLNFGGAMMKGNIRRLVNGHRPSASPRLCANPIQE